MLSASLNKTFLSLSLSRIYLHFFSFVLTGDGFGPVVSVGGQRLPQPGVGGFCPFQRAAHPLVEGVEQVFRARHHPLQLPVRFGHFVVIHGVHVVRVLVRILAHLILRGKQFTRLTRYTDG